MKNKNRVIRPALDKLCTCGHSRAAHYKGIDQLACCEPKCCARFTAKHGSVELVSAPAHVPLKVKGTR